VIDRRREPARLSALLALIWPWLLDRRKGHILDVTGANAAQHCCFTYPSSAGLIELDHVVAVADRDAPRDGERAAGQNRVTVSRFDRKARDIASWSQPAMVAG
jgi:hypothetical protein